MQTSQAKDNQTYVHKLSTPGAKLLEINREFQAPVERLFEAFANAESLKKWWWPHGMYADHIELDFRNGGKYFFNMKGNEQSAAGMAGHFEEIIKNKRIVMTDHFADTHGHPISAKEAKMPGDWPEMAYITFEFESINRNTSRFKLSQQGMPNEFHKDCIQGWSESFEKLEKFLGH